MVELGKRKKEKNKFCKKDSNVINNPLLYPGIFPNWSWEW